MNGPSSALPVRADVPPEPVPTQPLEPVATSPDSTWRTEGDQLHFTRHDRSYRIRGLEKNLSRLQLSVNILAARQDLVYLDTVDLARARSRMAFVKAVASELYVDEPIIKQDVGQLLLSLEDRQAQLIEQAQRRTAPPAMSDTEREAALDLLRDPRLLERIGTDLAQCGLVGEPTNQLLAYLAAVSRLLMRPLAVVIQSSSAAGKTSLMDAVLGLMPPEQQLKLSGLTGQALYYLEPQELKHKILAIAEDEGLAAASYALKLLQSDGELRHACVGKNAQGRLGTEAYHVEGPVQIVLTTTSLELEEELLNRCLVLSVDESREQTQAIHQRQRLAETREGKLAQRAAQRIRTLHQHAQRLLRPLEVYNPYAPRLTFTHDKPRLRRDHAKYLALINAIALLHQYQRPVRREELGDASFDYVEVVPGDIALANRLAAEVLGRSLDELPPQTRRFLRLMHEWVRQRCRQTRLPQAELRFTRKELREGLQWNDFPVRQHLAKLVELEYVLVHRGQRGRQFVYELLYDGQGEDGRPFLIGLLDPIDLEPPAAPTASGAKLQPPSRSERRKR